MPLYHLNLSHNMSSLTLWTPNKSPSVVDEVKWMRDDFATILGDSWSSMKSFLTKEVTTNANTDLSDLENTIKPPAQDATRVDLRVDETIDFNSTLTELEEQNLTDEKLMEFSPIKFLFTLQDNPNLLTYWYEKDGSSVGYKQAHSDLSQHMRIYSSSRWYNEDWSDRASNRTCLDWLQTPTMIWMLRLIHLAKVCWWVNSIEDVTATGWSENGHAQTDWLTPYNLTHWNWWKLDVRSHDAFGTWAIDTFDLDYWVAKTVNLRWQDLTLYYHWPNPHLDISFWPFSVPANPQHITQYIWAEDTYATMA